MVYKNLSIEFQFAALSFLVLIFIDYMYKRNKQVKTYFPLIMIIQMISLVLDIVTTFFCFKPNREFFLATKNWWWVPETSWRLYIVSTILFAVYFCAHVLQYCVGNEAFKNSDKHKLTRIAMSVITAADILLVIFFPPVYDDSNARYCYVWGNGALCHTVAMVLIFTIAIIHIYLYRNKLRKFQIISVISACAILALSVIVEIVFKPLVLGYATGILLFIFYFAWENPDIRFISELSAAKEEAFDASQAKTNFLASMSHEIRTPINVITGMGEMILRESNDQQILDYAQKIQLSSRFLLSLVNDILDISKVENGKLEISPVNFQMKPLLNSVISDMTDRAKEKNLKLNTNIDENIPSVLFGDDIRIRQILSNILTNAIKYTEKGEVTLEIKCEKVNNHAILKASVSDTGIGIKEENINMIFESFGRVREGKTHYIQGTGLGLPITKQLLIGMGSDIKVQSTYGKGSVFSFDLKLKIVTDTPIGNIFKGDDVLPAKTTEKTGPTFIAPDARILAVDDNSTNIFVLQAILKRLRVHFEGVNSGRAALEKIENNRYDLIFLDHMMPDLDGIETLKLMKQNEVFNSFNTPVIALTANAINGAKETYLEAGFNDYLSKPIDPERLEQIMLKYLPEQLIK